MTHPGYSLKLRTPPLDGPPDFFASMSDMNKASLVVLHELGIIGDELAGRLGQAIAASIEREAQPGARRSQDYLDFERDLLAAVGPQASWLHVGRSRQDMLSTGMSLWLRAAHLLVADDLLGLEQALLNLAERHPATVIPTYTHGVQAQPTSAAHYLLAFVAALDRAAERLQASFGRANRSPLGAGAGTTSSFALDRPRLAALLGFDGIVDNAFDANLVAPVDTALEFVQVLSSLAIILGQLTQDLHAQFVLAEPWLLFEPASMLTGISSMMPQKRNPRVLELLREHASLIVGAAGAMTLLAHNITSGQTDVRETVTTTVPLGRVHELLFLATRTIEAALIDPQRSLAEVDRDYSTMTNLAEYLVQSAGVPFREAHEFASRLTDYGRQHGAGPRQLAYADAARLYAEHAGGAPLPISEAEFRQALDPAWVVATRQGRGGPQPAEIDRLLAESRQRLGTQRQWLAGRRAALAQAQAELDTAFQRLQHAAVGPAGQAPAVGAAQMSSSER